MWGEWDALHTDIVLDWVVLFVLVLLPIQNERAVFLGRKSLCWLLRPLLVWGLCFVSGVSRATEPWFWLVHRSLFLSLFLLPPYLHFNSILLCILKVETNSILSFLLVNGIGWQGNMERQRREGVDFNPVEPQGMTR